MRKLIAAAALIAATIPTYASAAIETFASFQPATGGANFAFTQFNSGANGGAGGTLTTRGPGTTTPGIAKVLFDFLLDQNGGLDIPALPANFSFTATSHEYATTSSGLIINPGFAGSFSFSYSGAGTTINGIPYSTGANLLSGTFTGATLFGAQTSGGVIDSTLSLTNINYTSDIVQFVNNVSRDFSISLTAITAPVHTSGNVNAGQGDLKSFVGVATGSFSTDPAPIVNGAVPEMATWGMMVMGFGLIGGTIRSRRTSASIRLPVRQAEIA